MDRKTFLTKSGLATCACLFSDYTAQASGANRIRFGVIADIHHDIMHDSLDRLSAFIEEMNSEQPNFIIQLGDFCVPKQSNKSLLDIWNHFNGPSYHVIGNHDTDGGFNRDQVVTFWGAQAKYYSFDREGFHFIVLDGNEYNESDSRPPGYARFISIEQLNWLRKDLAETDKPTIVICHQGLDNDAGGIENGAQVRYALEQAEQHHVKKVILVLSGHHHQDYYNHINGIHYVQVNSASYQWLGEAYQEIRYSEEVDKEHPNIKYTVPYRDPLWAMIEIEPKGRINIKGKKSIFVGSSPEQLGVDMDNYIYPIVPQISDRTLNVYRKQ